MIPFPSVNLGQPNSSRFDFVGPTPWSATLISNFTLSNSDYTAAETSSSNANVMSKNGLANGRRYWELGVAVSGTPFDMAVGFRRSDESVTSAVNVGQTIALRANGQKFVGATGAAVSGGTFTFANGDRMMFAYANTNVRQFWIGKNGTWFDSGDPANLNNSFFSGFTQGVWHAYAWTDNSAGNHTINMYDGTAGRTFTYSPPSGFLALGL